MSFVGLSASTLAAIAGAVGLLTVLMYVLKLRRRPVSVPFSPIWQRVLKDKDSTHLFSQLKRWLSLLLQLLLVGLLILALGDPRPAEGFFESRHMVVLVDTSASMQATDVEPNRLEVAKKKLSEMVQGLSGTDRMLIAAMGPSPHPLSTLTDDVPALAAAIEALKATETEANLERSLRFARDSLRGLSKPEVIVLSDGALGDTSQLQAPWLEGVKLSYFPIGTEESNNVAITQFAVRRYPLDKSRYEVLLEVANTNDAPAEVELTLLGDGSVVDITTLKLDAQEKLPRIYSDLAGASRTLEARLRIAKAGGDHLEADNRAFALMPQKRRIKVLVVSSGNTYLEAALLLDEYLDVTLVAPTQQLPEGPFDVTILDSVAVTLRATHGSALYLNPPAEGSPVAYQNDKPIEDFGFDTWDKKSQLLAFIAPENIQVSTGHALKPGDGDKVVGASVKGPILVEGVRNGQRFIALGFDPRHSDLVLRVAWPLFLLNSVNHFVAEDARYLSSFRTGEVWHVPTPPEFELADLRLPSGQSRQVAVKNGHAVYFGELAGFYELSAGDDYQHEFAANLNNLEESRIKAHPELKLASAQAAPVEGFAAGVRRELWLTLLLVVLGLSTLEWFSYHRRVTV